VNFKEVAELKEAEENLSTRKSTINWVRVEPRTGYNTGNGHMPNISKPRTEWGRKKTYFKAITD